MTNSNSIQQRLLQQRKAYVNNNIYTTLSSTHTIQSEESAQKTEELEINDLKSLVSDLCTLSSYIVCGERAIAKYENITVRLELQKDTVFAECECKGDSLLLGCKHALALFEHLMQ
jgi:hypothetical protein